MGKEKKKSNNKKRTKTRNNGNWTYFQRVEPRAASWARQAPALLPGWELSQFMPSKI